MHDQDEDDDSVSARVLAAILANREAFLAFLERRLGQRHAAEEILQATYLKAVEASGTLPQEESAVAWFYRLLRNALVDRRRRQAIETRAVEQHGYEVALEADRDDELLKGVVCRCVDGLIPTLKPEYAEMVRQVDLGGVSVQEVAGALGVTANNASVRLHRARAALRKQLERTCGACAEHSCLDCTCRAVREDTVGAP